MSKRTSRLPGLAAVPLLIMLVGCGVGLADAILLVAQAGRTPSADIAQVAATLRASGRTVVGLALTS